MPKVYSIDGIVPVVHPSAFVHELTAEELQWKKDNMHLYQQLAQRSSKTMQRVEALTAVEPGRKRIDIPGSIPLSELKARTK
jgi:phenylacetic acid degradation protein